MLGVFPFIDPGLIVQFPAGKPLTCMLPVATEQVGCVIAPIAGVAGVPGFAMITVFTEADEVHPAKLVTVYEYVPAIKPGKVKFDPVPAIAPGLIVQFPAGRPASSILPVAIAHVGCAIEFTAGTDGVTGCALIITLAAAGEVHPAAFVTVKLYVPAAIPEIDVLAVFPAIAPGLIVQFPAGKPLKATLPVATAQVGWIIVPTIDADGVTG